MRDFPQAGTDAHPLPGALIELAEFAVGAEAAEAFAPSASNHAGTASRDAARRSASSSAVM